MSPTMNTPHPIPRLVDYPNPATCTSSLVTCTSSLANFTPNLAMCTPSLATSPVGLATNPSLATVTPTLATCDPATGTNSPAIRTPSLATCIPSLAACIPSLATSSPSLANGSPSPATCTLSLAAYNPSLAHMATRNHSLVTCEQHVTSNPSTVFPQPDHRNLPEAPNLLFANPETAPDAQVPWSPDHSPLTLSVQEILRARASLPIPRRKLTPRRPLPDPEPTGPQAARLRNWLISPPPAPVPPPSDHVPPRHRGLAPDLSDND